MSSIAPYSSSEIGGMQILLPEDVWVSETAGRANTLELLPEETASLGRAVVRRANEFAAGRACARNALAQMGVAGIPIPIGPSREPMWPAGVVGSITHCPGYCAAAVAFGSRWLSVGIDAEANGPLPDGVLSLVGSPGELAALEQLPRQGVHWDRLLFSAKESAFKAWWPVTRVWLGFEDAEVFFFPESRTFRVGLKKRHDRLRTRQFGGRFLVCEELLLTAITLPLPAKPGMPDLEGMPDA